LSETLFSSFSSSVVGSPSSFCNQTASSSSAVQHVSRCTFQHLQSNPHHLCSPLQHLSISVATQSSCKQQHNLTSSHADEIQSESLMGAERMRIDWAFNKEADFQSNSCMGFILLRRHKEDMEVKSTGVHTESLFSRHRNAAFGGNGRRSGAFGDRQRQQSPQRPRVGARKNTRDRAIGERRERGGGGVTRDGQTEEPGLSLPSPAQHLVLCCCPCCLAFCALRCVLRVCVRAAVLAS
jgi:hypothetical protein